MLNYTLKDDWFNCFLASNGLYLSGHASISECYGLDYNESISVRFIGNRSQIYLLVLTVSSNVSRLKNVVRVISENNRKILSRLEVFFNRHIPILIYDTIQANIFCLSCDGVEFKNINSDGLKDYFKSLDSKIIENSGSTKKINKSINDSFQDWTRRNLSKYLVINDFDGICINKGIVFELKRVQEDPKTWQPYLDDSSNYATQQLICRSSNKQFRVIAYQKDQTEYVACHIIRNINLHGIEGKYLICKPEQIFSEDISGYFNYYSKRKRIRTPY